MAFANRYCEIPISLRNSSKRIYPGVIGSYSFSAMIFLLVIVDEFDIGRPRRRSAEADPELVVHPDRVLASSVGC